MPDKCDMPQGPCSCGAWHTPGDGTFGQPGMWPNEQPNGEPADTRMSPLAVITLLEIHCHAGAYRLNNEGVRQLILARLIYGASPDGSLLCLQSLRKWLCLNSGAQIRRAHFASDFKLTAEGEKERIRICGTRRQIVSEPSICEQHAMGVHSSTGEVTP